MKKRSFPAAYARLRLPLMTGVTGSLLTMAATIYTGPLPAQKKAMPTATSQTAAPAFTYKIIPAANGTYGYNIYADGRLRIHQPSVPAMSGNEGFKTKVAAEKVAALAITKMKRGESLPTISPQELKKLSAI